MSQTVPADATELDKRAVIELGDELLVVIEEKDAYQWPQSSGDDHAGDPYDVPDSFQRSIHKKVIGNMGTGWNFEATASDEDRYGKYAINAQIPVLQKSSGVLRDRGPDVAWSLRLQWYEYPIRLYRV